MAHHWDHSKFGAHISDIGTELLSQLPSHKDPAGKTITNSPVLPWRKTGQNCALDSLAPKQCMPQLIGHLQKRPSILGKIRTTSNEPHTDPVSTPMLQVTRKALQVACVT